MQMIYLIKRNEPSIIFYALSEYKNMVLDDENPWDDILVSTMFALLRAMLHTTTQYTPFQ